MSNDDGAVSASWPTGDDRVCDGGTIADPTDLDRFAFRYCTVIAGDLTITGQVASEPDLFLVFMNVRHITGTLSIIDTRNLVALELFESLESAAAVILVNNYDLIDARLPMLSNATNVTVYGNTVLCIDGHPFATGGCGDVELVFQITFHNYFTFTGPTYLQAMQAAFYE